MEFLLIWRNLVIGLLLLDWHLPLLVLLNMVKCLLKLVNGSVIHGSNVNGLTLSA